jgi:hypothetical protein
VFKRARKPVRYRALSSGEKQTGPEGTKPAKSASIFTWPLCLFFLTGVLEQYSVVVDVKRDTASRCAVCELQRVLESVKRVALKQVKGKKDGQILRALMPSYCIRAPKKTCVPDGNTMVLRGSQRTSPL